MSDELFLDGKTYTSSKRAAAKTGYAQDYIGQLARKGLVDAQRVGGLWYVLPESLEAYKRNTDAVQPQTPQPKTSADVDTIVSLDGKDYVSASRAAKLTGYHPDYVGQLARAGKVLSRQVGNRWYVEREGLLAHKSQKDALLASVQAEAAGLAKSATTVHEEPAYGGPQLSYIREDDALFPTVSRPAAVLEAVPSARAVPIRVQRSLVAPVHAIRVPERSSTHVRVSRRSTSKTLPNATKAAAALTVVIMISYGLVTMQPETTYAVLRIANPAAAPAETMAASAIQALNAMLAYLETLVTKELHYYRNT